MGSGGWCRMKSATQNGTRNRPKGKKNDQEGGLGIAQRAGESIRTAGGGSDFRHRRALRPLIRKSKDKAGNAPCAMRRKKRLLGGSRGFPRSTI